jgi:hypothetical protein
MAMTEVAPRVWAEALARLDANRPPSEISSKRCLQFIDDCGQFLDGDWADRAEELGWGPLELFGCDRVKPYARFDRAGLLWLLNGGKLVALTAVTATIETTGGARQTYRRCPIEVAAVAPAWELALGIPFRPIQPLQPLACVAIVSVDAMVSVA